MLVQFCLTIATIAIMLNDRFENFFALIIQKTGRKGFGIKCHQHSLPRVFKAVAAVTNRYGEMVAREQ